MGFKTDLELFVCFINMPDSLNIFDPLKYFRNILSEDYLDSLG